MGVVRENQIVALITTMVVCGLLYLPGTDLVTSLVGVESAELLRMLGTGSRFESIARGVLDLRDLAYYASLMAVFLAAWLRDGEDAQEQDRQGLYPAE